jgi:hypothetical protein
MGQTDRIYKCLNPRGIESEVDIEPLAQRLDKLDGKTIAISSQEVDPVIMPALIQRLRHDLPKVRWLVKDSGVTEQVSLNKEEMQSTDALIQGVAW